MMVGTPELSAGPFHLPGLPHLPQTAPYLLLDFSDRQGNHLVDLEDQDGESPQKHPMLVCRTCGHTITSEDQRIEVAGAHLHTLFNSAGIVFELGCFRRAPGCSALGEASNEFTWFAGYVWRIALCARCGTHLGWHFQSAETSFYGLIFKNLQSRE